MLKKEFINDSISSLDESDLLGEKIPRDTEFEKISIIKPNESVRFFMSPTDYNIEPENKAKLLEEEKNIEEQMRCDPINLDANFKDCEKVTCEVENKSNPMKVFQRRGVVYKRLLAYNTKILNITSYEVRNVFFKFVRYGITITQNIKKSQQTIYRRYNEFGHLRDLLKLKYFGILIPSLPFKECKSARDMAFIEFRKKFLQIFLHELQTLPFFDSSEDILAFLNPVIGDFLDIRMIDLNTLFNDDAILYNGLEFLKKGFGDKTIYVANKGHQTLETINQIKYYLGIFEKNMEMLKNISLVLNEILTDQKEFENQENSLINELIVFQEEFIFAMNPGINVFNYNTNKSLKETSKTFKETWQRMIRNNYKVKIIKNLNDWIYKELIDLEAMIEYVNSLFPFLDKVIEIDNKIRRDQSSDQLTRHSLEKKKQLMKEIISVMSAYMLNIEFEKFKAMRIDFFYNSLRYMVINNDNINLDKTVFAELTENFLQIMKMYLNNNPKLHKSKYK
jgi:hypothetical protein